MEKNSIQKGNTKGNGAANHEKLDWKRRFELIAEASGQIIYDYCVKDGSIKWSGGIEKVLGYRQSELKGGIKQWEKLIHEDDRKEAVRLLEIAEKDFTLYEIEYRFKHKDGHYVEILDHGFFIPGDKGKSERMLGTMQDISPQKRSRKLITALNTAVLEMQKVFSREDIFRVVARELKKMNIDSLVLLVDDERKNLFFEYYSYDSKLIKVAEKIAGMKAISIMLPIDSTKEYNDVINHKKTVLVYNSVDFVRPVLPRKVKFMSEQLTKMFKISRFILAPLIVEDRVFGTFSVQADDLLDSDIPSVTMFAHQLAGAWNKGELYENSQREIAERKEAVTSLKQSEERFSKVFKSSPYAISISDFESGQYIDVNDNFLKLIGFSREEVIGKNSIELNLWIDSVNRKKTTEKLRKEGSIKNIQNDFRTKSGEIKTWKSSLEIIELNGSPCILSMIEDITEQKRTEKVLQEREEIFRKIFEESPIGMVMSDESSNFIKVNEFSCKMLGYTEEEIKTKKYLDITHPDYPALESEIEIVEKIKTGELPHYKAEKPYLTKNKETVWGSLTLSSIRDKNGEFQHFLALIEDITERKVSEQKLNESNRKLNTLINNLTGVVYRCLNDKDWTMEFISEGIAELSGYQAEDFIYNKVRTFDSIIEPEDRYLIWNEIQNALDENNPFTLEYRINCANGEQKWVWERGSGIYEENKLVALEGYITDITRQKHIAQVLRDSEATLKTFINALPEPAFLIDKNYNVLLTNKSHADSFNLPPEKIIGKNIYEILSKEDADIRAKYINEVINKEEPVTFESSRDNLTYINYLYPVFEEEKRISKVAIFSLDITGRLKTEKENLLLAQTLKSVKDAISITDLNNNVIFVNDAFLETYGFIEEEVIGKNISFANPEGFDKVSDAIHEQTIKGGYHGELINVRKDGSELPVELWTSVVKDANNNIMATVGVARDITNRLKAERENILLAQTLKSVKDAISITDMDNKIIFVNDAFLEIYGYKEIDVIGKHISFIVSDKNPSDSIKKVKENTIDGNWYGELINTRKDGSEFPIELWTSVVKDVNNNNAAMVGVARDITKRKQFEKEIEDSNKKLLQAQRVARIGSWEDYLPTGELSWSDEMYNIFGIKKDAKISLSETMKLFPPEEAEKLKSAVEGAVTNKKPYSMDYKIITPGGTVKYIHDEGKIIYDESGNAVWMYGTTQDITENKLAEIALKESEEKMQSIFRVAPTGIGIVRNRILIDINPRVCEMTGYTKEELIGKSARILYPTQEEFDYVGDEKYRQIHEKGTGLVETRWLKKNGKIINIILASTPIDRNDTSRRVIFTALDITEREQTEENLRRSEERFKQVAESADEWIWEVNTEGLYTYASPVVEKILGFGPEEIVNKKHFYDLFLPVERDEIKNAAFELFGRKEKIKGLINKNVHKNGNVIILETSGVPVLDDENNLLGYRGVDTNITERKRAEEELIRAKEKAEEMNRIKTNFLANMSHEVRTPLVAILGFSEVLSDLVKEDELKNFVDMIHKGGERLLDTLNLILDLSIIEAQKIKIDLEPLDIVEETKQIVDLFEKAAAKKQLKIYTEFEFESYVINLDLKILRQITNNLVNNAIKYTNSGEIKVRLNKEVKDKEEFIALRVEDTGIGIPDDMKDLIWEEFRQVSEGLNRSFEGTGLGLSITKKFVEKLGGVIYLEKSEIDIGSVFTVLFPAGDKSISENSKDLKHGGSEKKLKRKAPRILYVEDDHIAIDIVKTFIKDSYIVEGATTGKEGIEKAQNNYYDAILMDINLGRDMDGLEATKIIRGLPGYEKIPIVAVTAFAMMGDKEEFFEKGCTHYISKPFTKKEFQNFMAEILPIKNR